MAKGKLIVICQSGGKFTPAADASLSYSGGDAHAMSINNDTRFAQFKSEIAEMCNCDLDSITLKYFLPNNKHTLITISSDKDIQRMIEFHEDSATVDVYVIIALLSAGDDTITPCSGSSRTTAAEHVSPVSTPSDVVAAYAEDTGQQKLSATWKNCITGVQKLSATWKNCITGVDQQFNGIREFRDELRKYSLAHGFLFKYINNSCKSVSAKCKAEGCPWYVLASKLSTTPFFRIKKMNGTHTCGVGANRPAASAKLVASIAKEKLRNSLNCKPRDIVAEIQRELGLELPYNQAWRAVETAREELHGSHKEAYNMLPWLCEKIIETNPGSVATLITKEDLCFRGLFVAFHASVYGFLNGCRPLLFLDNMVLSSKYQGELLTASGLDGNDGIFPVAFAIVDELNDDNWHWFLAQLESVLQTSQSMTLVAEKKEGTSEALSRIFKNCHHAYCLHHLTENLKAELKGRCSQDVRVIVAEFNNAARALTVEGFKKSIQTMRLISKEAYEWAQQNNPEHWATAFFRGSRYNHDRSNMAESFYSSWVSELHALPIVQVIETMRRKMTELFYTRRSDSDEWSSSLRLTPSSEEKLQKNTLNSRSVEVLFSPGSAYKVGDSLGVVYVVNLDKWECSCREWQITGLPCLHAVAVIERFDKNVYDYCSKYFTVDTYRLSYSETVNPVPIADRPMHQESSPVRVHPPSIRRSLGRPSTNRSKRKREPEKSSICSKCKGMGHNKRSCKQSSELLPTVD